MSIDAITLHALVVELNESLCQSKVEKIYQPEPAEITFSLRAAKGSTTLVLCAGALSGLYTTGGKRENEPVAPAFCMLLRKYLTGAKITDISLIDCDRIVKVTFEARNELMDKTSLYLVAELTGRCTNILLLNSQYKIIDALKKVYPEQNPDRIILPGTSYPALAQDKIRPDQTEMLETFFTSNPKPTAQELTQNIGGINKYTAAELAAENEPFAALNEYYNINSSPRYAPCLRHTDGNMTDCHIFPYRTAKGEYTIKESLSASFEAFFTKSGADERKKRYARTAAQLLKRAKNKIERRIAENEERISESAKSEALRVYGELITANIYKIQRGDDILVCLNYYTGNEETIPLDITLSPAANAQSYYKKYAKLKRARAVAEEQLAQLWPKREYLISIDEALNNCTLKSEFDEITAELNAFGASTAAASNKINRRPSAPMHFVIDGLDVYVGKNNKQNAQVTFKIGEANDTWLHAKNYHGAHAVIKGKPTEKVIEKTAQIVAYFSGCRAAAKAEVDYTLRRCVKKVAGAYEGFVTYTNNKTVLVKPDNKPELLR